MTTDDHHITFVGAATVLREHGFDLFADEITTLWTASRATVTGQATRIMELEAERDYLYRALNPPEVAAPSPVADRGALACALHAATGCGCGEYLGQDVRAADALLARYDIRELADKRDTDPQFATRVWTESEGSDG
jgi:hypothetical protein